MSNYSQKILINKIKTYWPDENPQEIIDFLNEYGVESYEKEIPRVQIAILKLCQGDQKRIKEFVMAAKTDYRDVLAWAEYPEEINIEYQKLKNMPAEEVKKLRQRDRDQYLNWLND